MPTSGRLILPLTEPAFTEAGVLDPGATLTVFLTGTTTLAELFGDSGLTIPIVNPQIADSAGRFYAQATAIYADSAQAYDCRLLLTDGELFTWDAIVLLAASEAGGGFMPISGGLFTGPVSGPTPPANDDSNLLATTAFVQEEIAPLAPINSAAFTGVPTAPTAAPGTNTAQLATTAFVEAAFASIPSEIFATVLITGGVPSVELNNGFSSIVRTGTGAYGFTFATPMADTKYGVFPAVSFLTSLVAMVPPANKTVNGFAIQVLEPSNNVQQDPNELYVQIKGS